MATDGVKIIDGDLAHNVYHTFMDLYDAGKSLPEIQATIEQLQAGNDDFDDEIFMTAYALALWEIGALGAEVLQQVQEAIQRGAFVSYLTKVENSPGEARKRQQVLNRFWKKISLPNTKFRKRKLHKQQTKFIFQEGAVLAFHMPDGTYRATILLFISQHRSRCEYFFTMPTYTEGRKPTLADIVAGEIMGRTYKPPNFPEYRLGFDVTGIGHNHLRAFADRFEVLGQLKITPAAQCCGRQGGVVCFESFISDFRDFNDFSGVKKTAKTHFKTVFAVQKLL